MSYPPSDSFPIVLIDSREKKPWHFDNYPVHTETTTLLTGDYTFKGYEDVFAVERKSLDDLTQSLSWGRDRFKDEIRRSTDLAEFAVVIESPISDVRDGNYYSKMHPNSILGSVRSWERYYDVDFHWLDNRRAAEAKTYDLLCKWKARHQDLFF